jgi:hypothetical protein
MTTTPARHINAPVATMEVERGRAVGASPKPRLETAFNKAIVSARAGSSWDEDAPDEGGV